MTKAPLGQRLFEGGNPNPEYALLSTVHWMRSLAILTQQKAFTAAATAIGSNSNQRRETRQDHQDRAFEKLFLARSYLAALRSMTTVSNPHDVARVAIVSWYYCVYSSSQAMLAIAGQPVPEEHTKTARVWLNQLVAGPSSPLIPYPFDQHVSTLVKAAADEECARLNRGTGQNVNRLPATPDQAHDAHVSYLKGSSGFYREKIEEKVRGSREFLNAGYKDFRTNGAREIRDRALSNRSVGFLDMAFRYRGKANYRDAIFLCYGSHGPDMNRFLDDAFSVAGAYHRLSELWVSARTPDADWKHLVEDLQSNSKLTAAT